MYRYIYNSYRVLPKHVATRLIIIRFLRYVVDLSGMFKTRVSSDPADFIPLVNCSVSTHFSGTG